MFKLIYEYDSLSISLVIFAKWVVFKDKQDWHAVMTSFNCLGASQHAA